MFDILSLIPGKKKYTHSGWHSFNAICCSHRGHKPDKRMRGGIRLDGHNWSMHCFNCGYTCSFMLGRSINNKTRQFLMWCGVDMEQVQKWNLESLQNRDLLQLYLTQKKLQVVKFKSTKLPDDTEQITDDSQYKFYSEYLDKRKIDYDKYSLYCTPNGINRAKYGIVIPYTYKGKIVGHTTRFLDHRTPKYINEQQPGYVFNMDMQRPDWSVCIVTEGIFDAMSIDGVALMHDDISTEQSMMLATLNRKIIVVPDFDKTGLKITDRALELGYHVSLPNWSSDIKDVNDAVVKYGKLATILSIIENATMSKIKIEMRKKQIAKGI